jgi:hypothetical protein
VQSVRGVLDTTLCNKVCQWLAAGLWFSAGPPVSSTNKTDRHNITEILLKVVLNTIKPKPTIVPLEGHIGLTVYFLQFFLFTFTGQKFFLSEIFPCKLHIKITDAKKNSPEVIPYQIFLKFSPFYMQILDITIFYD